MDYFTLHIRLTKGCNAQCDYCSSDNGNTDFIGVERFKQSIDFISSAIIPKIAPDAKALTIQYVGGEITTIPVFLLNECVEYAREVFANQFPSFVDGVQSNLIASKPATQNIYSLFGERVGTSIDGLTGQRKIKGSAEKYNVVFNKNIEEIKKKHAHPASIFVVDSKGIDLIPAQVSYCEKNSCDLTLRPVFPGASDVSESKLPDLIQAFENAFDKWLLNSHISIEPFTHLVRSRLSLSTSSCPFQSNCSRVSLDLEPNGDLYTCLDMADSNQFCLGNAVNKEFHLPEWRKLDKRRLRLDSDCVSCPYLSSCQGGCMSEAIHHTGSIYGKTEFCLLWKSLFSRIDDAVSSHGEKEILTWLNRL
jgi:radical SAM protein with 4Fe4S-binding SPASM domain